MDVAPLLVSIAVSACASGSGLNVIKAPASYKTETNARTLAAACNGHKGISLEGCQIVKDMGRGGRPGDGRQEGRRNHSHPCMEAAQDQRLAMLLCVHRLSLHWEPAQTARPTGWCTQSAKQTVPLDGIGQENTIGPQRRACP